MLLPGTNLSMLLRSKSSNLACMYKMQKHTYILIEKYFFVKNTKVEQDLRRSVELNLLSQFVFELLNVLCISLDG